MILIYLTLKYFLDDFNLLRLNSNLIYLSQ